MNNMPLNEVHSMLLELIYNQKKQFNAPFLFSLQEQFHTERIIEKIKQHDLLDTDLIQNLIQSFKQKNQDGFSYSYKQSLLQSLVSFTYVDDYLIHNHSPQRNLTYEDEVLRSE